jgi:tetratricopeptide (TPR) repeat protein
VKKIVVAAFAAFCITFIVPPAKLPAASVLSESEGTWKVLESAHVAFESGEYGTALRLAETAKQNKKSEYERYSKILTDALKPAEVRRAGDSLAAVLAVLDSRNDTGAAEILRFFAQKTPAGETSVSWIVGHIKKMYVLPEAEWLIGRIYFYESELSVARDYYMRAWEHSFALDIPEQRYDILYEMAGLAEMLDDDELFEKSLLLVLADDPYYNRQAANDAMQANLYDSMKSALARNYTLDRIFLMYRADRFRSLKAYIALAKFYRDRGMKEEFLKTSLLGSLTAFTRMYSVLVERDVGYEYKGVEDFFARALRYRDMTLWSINQDVWDCFYYLYEAAGVRSFDTFANELLAVLASLSPDVSVRERAAQTAARRVSSR